MKSLFFNKIDKDDFYITDLNNTSLFYGEANYNDVCKIINKYKKNKYHMLDVGSGCGKIVFSCCIELDISVDGIEIDENRFRKSEILLEKLNLYHKINFINDNFSNIYFGNYDLLYCCNLIFEDKDNELLYNKIKKEFCGLFILFKFDKILLPYLISKDSVDCSWSKNVAIYIFLK